MAATLNEAHKKEAQRVNASRAIPNPYKVGDWMWLIRPRNSGVSKLDTWWVGPCEVVRRVGSLSYQVMVKPGVLQDVHAQQLKPFVGDKLHGEGLELFHYSTGYKVLDTQPDEWNVETILGHRRKPDGKLEFLTKWEGAEPGEETWEPPSNFVTRYCVEFVQYLKKNRLPLQLSEVLVGQVPNSM